MARDKDEYEVGCRMGGGRCAVFHVEKSNDREHERGGTGTRDDWRSVGNGNSYRMGNDEKKRY